MFTDAFSSKIQQLKIEHIVHTKRSTSRFQTGAFRLNILLAWAREQIVSRFLLLKETSNWTSLLIPLFRQLVDQSISVIFSRR